MKLLNFLLMTLVWRLVRGWYDVNLPRSSLQVIIILVIIFYFTLRYKLILTLTSLFVLLTGVTRARFL